RCVAAGAADGGDAGLAEDRAAVVGLAGANAAERADPAALPGADDFVCLLGMRPHDRFEAGAHDREQHFHAVNTVPEQIGMSLLNRTWAVSVAAENFTNLRIDADRLHAGRKAQGRAGKT